MGSFMLMSTRTCSKYLQPLLGHHLLYYYRQCVPNVLQGCKNPHVQLFSTHKKNRPKKSVRSSKPTDLHSEKEQRPFLSLFTAGAARIRHEKTMRPGGQQEKKREAHTVWYKESTVKEVPDRPLSPEEWRTLRDASDKPDQFANCIMTLMMNGKKSTDLNVAKSLLAFIAVDSGTVPYALLLKYLSLCVSGGHHSEFLDTYDVMRSCFKTLDTSTYTMVIRGISQTERWREILPLLEEMKKVFQPSRRNYSDAILGMFLHGDSETAWKLYGEMMELGIEPKQDLWKFMFDKFTGHQKDKDKLLNILTYMRENQVYPQEMLVQSIKTWFESLPDERWTGRFSSVNSRNQCNSCHTELESIELTEEEYAHLKHTVMEKVIKGRDIFTKTTPQELQLFKDFVKNSPAFDVIVDGLNVANMSQCGRKSQNLLEVVSELCKQGFTVLVLGRKHMLQDTMMWNKNEILKIKQIAHCFFTDNISHDDPFLLYAALHSGNKCMFLSRDLMRDHKALLPDTATWRLFFKWQRGHQLVMPWYRPRKNICFQRAFKYDTIVQSTRKTWHIPYDDDSVQRSSCEVPQKWLCLTKKH